MKHNRKIKKPLSKGTARVPFIMQMEALECGAASLAMCLAYFGRHVPLEKVRQECGVSRDGSNLKNIYRVADSYGMHPRAFFYETAALRVKGTYPCIIHWEFNHFVVLDGFRGGHAVINDPARGVVHVSMEEFDRAFTGICLFFNPGEDFVCGGEAPSVWNSIRECMKGTGAMLGIVLLSALITTLLSVWTPAFSRVFVDNLLGDRGASWTDAFFAAVVLAGGLQAATALIKALYLPRLQGKQAVYADTSFVWHILRLPMEFFSQRMTGEVLDRQNANQEMASMLVEMTASLLLNGVSMLFAFVLMLCYSVPLAMIGISAVLINALLTLLVSRRRMNMMRIQKRTAGQMNSTTVSGISMIETIKSSGAEAGFFGKWAGYQAIDTAELIRASRTTLLLEQLPVLLSLLSSNVILYFGVSLIMRGEWTIGVAAAFNGYLTAFSTPAAAMVKTYQDYEKIHTDIERVEDLMHYPEDVFVEEDALDTQEGHAKLSGRIALRDVSFGYDHLSAPLIEHFNLSMEAGQSIAVVGGSGSGKSTLAHLLCGLYRPWTGAVYFDDTPLSEIPRSIFTASVASIDQNVVLFEDTVAQNIRMWDASIEDFEVILAAKDAQIHDDIMCRPLGYRQLMRDGGKNFSGGQRQRIEIARALAQDPRILVMDEATSALDAQTEYDVIRSIHARGISTVIISHRLSTVRECDEIIVLRGGKVEDRGRHEALMERCAYYRSLIVNE